MGIPFLDSVLLNIQKTSFFNLEQCANLSHSQFVSLFESLIESSEFNQHTNTYQSSSIRNQNIQNRWYRTSDSIRG